MGNDLVPSDAFQRAVAASNQILQRYGNDSDVKFVGKQAAIEFVVQKMKFLQGMDAAEKLTELSRFALSEAIDLKEWTNEELGKLSPEVRSDIEPLYQMLKAIYDKQLPGTVAVAGEAMAREVNREITFPSLEQRRGFWK